MHTIQTLKYVVEHNQLLAYFLIFFITIFEGEVVVISSGILIALGALNLWIAFIAIVAGGIIKSFLGYSIGTFLHTKFNDNRFFQYIERKVLSIMPHFEAKPFWSIFASKFLMVNHIVIIFAGYKKIEFKKYIQAELLSTVLWAVSLLTLGYFFSYAAFKISHKLSEFLLIIVLFIVGFFVLEKIVSLLYNVFEYLIHDNEQSN
jgi:membrane protein DedA with SNARE-associated domain